MRYLSLFSGIEAATVAWHPLGWTPVAFAQYDPEHDYSRGPDFPSAVLAHHYPDVPNLGDVTKIDELDIAMLGPIDLVVFGSPCQDLSQAGNRAGLKGSRSGLFFDALRIVRWAQQHCGCQYVLWENVPGALSSNRGRDFALVVGQLAGLAEDELGVPPKGWGNEGAAVGPQGLVEWSVLDAQWFGVAQRRRRVFALLDTGNWADRPPVLLEPESLRGSAAPRRESWQDAAPGAGAGASHNGGVDLRNGALTGAVTHPVQVAGRPPSPGGQPHVLAYPSDDPVHAICANEQRTYTNEGKIFQLRNVVAFKASHYTRGKDGAPSPVANPPTKETDRGDQDNLVLAGVRASEAMAVRRLTPVECERLQGFSDGYTAITYRGKPAADGPRYKALGNSFAVPVVRWIGKQITNLDLFAPRTPIVDGPSEAQWLAALGPCGK